MSDELKHFDENVVPFPRGQFERMQNEREAALEELPVRTKREARTCWHRQHGTFVAESARAVTCRGCGAALDPIEVLAWIAHDRENLVHAGRCLRSERDYLEQEVEKLKRQERNAKARIRRARSRREDAAALEAAVSVGVRIDSYRPWEELNNAQRAVVIERVRLMVEAYHGAFTAEAESDLEEPLTNWPDAS